MDDPVILRLILLLFLMTLVVYYDLKDGKVYNWITMPAMAIGIIINVFLFDYHNPDGIPTAPGGVVSGYAFGLKWSIFGGACGFGVFFFFYLIGLMMNYKFIGGGDVKLMGAIGCLTGPTFIWHTIYWTILAASILGIMVLLRNGVFLKGIVRATRLFFLLPPDKNDDKPIVEGGVHYCLAIAMGTVFAFMELNKF